MSKKGLNKIKDFIIFVYNRVSCLFIRNALPSGDEINKKQSKSIFRKKKGSEQRSDIKVLDVKVKKVIVKKIKNEN